MTPAAVSTADIPLTLLVGLPDKGIRLAHSLRRAVTGSDRDATRAGT